MLEPTICLYGVEETVIIKISTQDLAHILEDVTFEIYLKFFTLVGHDY